MWILGKKMERKWKENGKKMERKIEVK